MLLKITAELPSELGPQSEFGYLMGKHPGRVQEFEVSAGVKARVFCSELTESKCTFALVLEINTVDMVRDHKKHAQASLHDYVNDRPYVSSSFLSTAIARVLGSALSGKCKDRPHLVNARMPLQATITSLRCYAGKQLIERLFEPLGYTVDCVNPVYNEQISDWGNSPYHTVTLSNTLTLRELLAHLYVLMPVLDNGKHYFIFGPAEVEKLLRHGEGWLASHPLSGMIAARYVRHRQGLAAEVLEKLQQMQTGLTADDESVAVEQAETADDYELLSLFPAEFELVNTATESELAEVLAEIDQQEVATESDLVEAATGIEQQAVATESHLEDATRETPKRAVSLNQQRYDTVLSVLREVGARSVIDMGCGEGNLLVLMCAEEQIERVSGMEVSHKSLAIAHRQLRKYKRLGRQEVQIFFGSLIYRDPRTTGYDAAVAVEVLEHFDPDRLPTFEESLFGVAAAKTVILTTPNCEYNVRYPGMAEGAMRHKDHRFEWTRAEFRCWCGAVAQRRGYSVRYLPVGPEDPEVGPSTQMAVFSSLVAPIMTQLSVTAGGVALAFSTVGAEQVGIGVAGDDSDRELVIPDLLQLATKPNLDNSTLPGLSSVLGRGFYNTRLVPKIKVRTENAAPALEAMSRFVVDHRWLVYVPPTMSPSETSQEPGYLEHPTEAFDYYRDRGVTQLICEKKHMGSRAVVIVCKDELAAQRRFGVSQGAGICYTRMGRRYFNDPALETQFLDKVRQSLTDADFWSEMQTDWVVLDCELMPWNGKSLKQIKDQYAGTGAAAVLSLTEVVAEVQTAADRGLPVESLLTDYKTSLECAHAFRRAYSHYCWPINSLADYKLAPFHIMATEGAVHIDKTHVWHMDKLARVAQCSDGLIIATPYVLVDVTSDDSRNSAISWWEQLTASGGEGMVVKPLDFVVEIDDPAPGLSVSASEGAVGNPVEAVAAEPKKRLVQPAIKCRGREYLRIIYGPDYTLLKNLDRLRERATNRKRALACFEFALGVEGLERFVAGQPFAAVHECAFGVVALETTPMDPRL